MQRKEKFLVCQDARVTYEREEEERTPVNPSPGGSPPCTVPAERAGAATPLDGGRLRGLLSRVEYSSCRRRDTTVHEGIGGRITRHDTATEGMVEGDEVAWPTR